MRNREEVAKIVTKIISEEGHVYRSSIKESETLKSDLDIDTDYFRDIKKALNKKYSLELTKSDIKDCVDVEDVIDLVYEQLNKDISGIDDRVKRIIYYKGSNVTTSSLKGNESLRRDLYIDNDEYREIKEDLNNKYNLDLKKKDIKQCDDVQDVINLVSERLGVGTATVVHVWCENSTHIGHSSLELRDGTYISFWPGGKKAAGTKDVLWNTSHPPHYIDHYDEDYEQEGYRDSAKFRIKSAREDLIKKHWRKIRTERRLYHYQHCNCSTVIAELLYVATGRQPSFQEEYETHRFGIKLKARAWHPADIAKYARELQ